MSKFKKPLNLIVFVALMGTSALALASQIIFQNTFFHFLAVGLEIGVILVFLYYFILLLEHIFLWKGFLENIKNPAKANLYSAMPIAAALITIMLITIKLPLFTSYNLTLAFIFWLISVLFSLFFVIIIPINLKFRSQLQHISGSWFLPPVGLFVLITAGSTLALKLVNLKEFIAFMNLFLLGPAFILYFLTLNLIYYKSKIQIEMEEKMMPTFHIVLAPVAVSILAMLSTAKLLSKTPLVLPLSNIVPIFSNLSFIYSLIIYGYGLWVILGLSALYYRTIKEKKNIPFSELWWVFVFPTGAFVLATVNLYQIFSLAFLQWIYYIFYFILLALWLYVISKVFTQQSDA